jgi:hypothetical protein
MSQKPQVGWNTKLRLAFSDVDETIAEVYAPADPGMITELSSFLSDGGKLCMATGGSLARVTRDVTDRIHPRLRRHILVSHCSGAEVWGFTESGKVRDKPFYSVYEEKFTPAMKQQWRDVIQQLVDEFKLRAQPAEPKANFWERVGRHPLDIMLDDRGPQITMEVVNGVDLTDAQLAELGYEVPTVQGRRDLRTAIERRAVELLSKAKIPIAPHQAGTFALDFAVEGVSKTTSITTVLNSPEILATIGLRAQDIRNPEVLEVWGDKFSTINGGTDRLMSFALPPEVRSIDFRQENPAELPEDYNIVTWDGQQHLHHGLLEFLQSRHQP